MKLIYSLFTSLLLMSCKGATAQQTQNITDFDFDLAKNKEVILIDVRTPKEFAEEHLPFAKNINIMDENFENQFTQLDKKETIYLYCRSGMRSAKAQKIAQQLGYTNVINLEGGILAWKAAQKPIEK